MYLVEFYETDTNPPVKFVDGVMYVRDVHEMWHPIRACFRYVTQRPWNRIPLCTKTLILNPIQACLAGGRNKVTIVFFFMMIDVCEREPVHLTGP